jgi:hypothetical protein
MTHLDAMCLEIMKNIKVSPNKSPELSVFVVKNDKSMPLQLGFFGESESISRLRFTAQQEFFTFINLVATN